MSINEISAATAIVIFAIIILYKSWKKTEIILADIVLAAMAGGMLPLAIGFILYPFFPYLIGSIEEMSLQITLTGLVLTFVYVKTIIEKLKSKVRV
ncbi:MAG: hypothetical protein AAF731_06150 [Bacteroidota bacterium]